MRSEHEQLMRSLSWPFIIGWWLLLQLAALAFILPLQAYLIYILIFIL